MSIRQMTRVWDESPYEGTRLLIHLAMADFAHDDGQFFASQKLMAAKARCSVEYVRKFTRELIEAQLLSVIKKGSSVGRATVYQMLWKEINPPTVLGSEDLETPQLQTPNSPTLTAQLPNSAQHHPSYTTVLTTTISETALAPLAEQTVQELHVVVAKQWWESQTVKPIGKSAWHSLLQIVKAALDKEYTPSQILSALEYIGTVPSMRQMDLILRGVGVTRQTTAMTTAQQALEMAAKLQEVGQ